MNVGKFLMKHPKAVAVVGGLAGLAGSAAAAYSPNYATSDLGTAIIDLLVKIVVSIASQGGSIGQLIVVILVISIIGGVFTVLIGLVGTALGMFNAFGNWNKPGI
jgi:hypothetical protein